MSRFTVKRELLTDDLNKWMILNANRETVARTYCAETAQWICALMNNDPNIPACEA
jgi:hypothetical protein